jgi:hypothetical protein
MDAAEKYRRQLLEQSQYIYYDTPISEATASAYLETPRHLFVPLLPRVGIQAVAPRPRRELAGARGGALCEPTSDPLW